MNRRDFIKSSVCAMGVLAAPGFAYSSIDVDTKNVCSSNIEIDIMRYKSKTIANNLHLKIEHPYSAIHGVFAVYLTYNSNRYLLDSISKVIYEKTGNNLTYNFPDYISFLSLYEEEVAKYSKHFNKFDISSYDNIAYGGYTLESADLYGDPVKLGRYNVFYNASLLHANHNTLGLYQDKIPVLGEKRMLIKAGGDIRYTCSGICLYNSYLDRKISEHSPLYHRTYVGIRTLLPTLIKGSAVSPKYMETIENIKVNII